MPINDDAYARWMDLYRSNLKAAMTAHPEDYLWPSKAVSVDDAVDIVAGKMGEAFRRGSYNKSGRAVKATCKQLGISHTYTAINAYLAAQP